MDYLTTLKDIPFFSNKDKNVLDNLTGVLNRASAFDYIEHLIAEKKQFALVELDIDNFKFINDSYGHLVGDKVIIEAANWLVEILGTTGIVGRYGGDEFVIIHEGSVEYDDVWAFGHKILNAINGHKIKEIRDRIITVTCGIARFPTDAKDLTELFETADKAMYRGKTKGRDCFIIYLPEKHKDINLKSRNDVRQSLFLLFQEAFGFLNRKGEYINNLRDVIYFLTNQFMFDHVCIQSNTKIVLEAVGPLSRTKQFSHIPLELVEKNMNASGMFILNNMKNFDTILPELHKVDEEQGVKGQLMMKICHDGNEYGMLRIDTTTTGRIWQNEELALVMTIANFIAKDLFYKGFTLDDL